MSSKIKDKGRYTFFHKAFAGFLLAVILAGCSLNEATGEREFDPVKAEQVTEQAKEVVEQSPLAGTPLGIAIGAVLTIFGVGCGYFAKKEKPKKTTKEE